MKIRRNSIFGLVIALALGFMLFIAFAVPRKNAPLSNLPPSNQQRLNYEGNLMRSNPIATTIPKVNPTKIVSLDKQKTDKIQKQLSKMKELSKVGTVVAGNTALVGYSPSKGNQNVNMTKTLIAKKVKQIDPSIKNVVVSESADIMARINKLTKDITKKLPANEISNEINQLLKGVAPVVK